MEAGGRLGEEQLDEVPSRVQVHGPERDRDERDDQEHDVDQAEDGALVGPVEAEQCVGDGATPMT